MLPLIYDDLIPLDEYIADRSTHVRAAAAYLDRYRRVRVGPKLTLVFENRQTLWFRVHELFGVARLTEPVRVQQELNWYNRLLPSRGRLQAALHIDISEGPEWKSESEFWRDIADSALTLSVGTSTIAARFVTNRVEDRSFGAAHWVEFAVDAENAVRLVDHRMAAMVAVVHGDYRHQSSQLSDAVRTSLADDLAEFDRGAAGRRIQFQPILAPAIGFCISWVFSVLLSYLRVFVVS